MSAPAPDLEQLVGRVLDGRYRLDALLGQGGMGAVFRAYHIEMDRRVAVKVLRPHLVGDPIAARRFAREAKGTFKVGSENAVKVHDFAIDPTGGLAFMVMEYLDGRTVGAELSVDGPFAPARAVHVMRQVCDALGAAHRLGLVHRDIKPDNIMLQVRGSDPDFAKVLDFGLAKLADNAGVAPFSIAAITQGDMVFGTPDYMSPEQAKGQPLDARSDLYAVGITLFEMITGRCPFVEPSAILLLARHVQAEPPRMIELMPDLASLPGFDAVETVVARLLAKSPAARPLTADACAAELDAAARALAATPIARGDRSAASTMDLDAPPTRGGVPSVFLPSHSELTPRLRRRGAAIAVALAGLAILATVIIAVAARKHPTTTAAAAVATVTDAASVSDSVSVSDSASASGSTSASGSASASGSTSASGSASVSVSPASTAKHADAARHVAAAAAARAAGNRLKQLAEADLALRADPHNAEARFLLGDVLVATGDIKNGCQYLRSVKRMSKARAAAAAAGCPAD